MDIANQRLGERPLVLSVDDEPDIHSVTRLSVKSMKLRGRKLKLLTADTGAEAVQVLRENPGIAVVLLDVVMESDTAGLDTVKAIREELGNRFVRIILRTGQPGQAPERETIDEYDIDGYLPKAGLSNTRLYAAVRTAIRAWEELLSLERHRQGLDALQRLALSLRSDEALDSVLEQILATALGLCPCKMGLLELQTFAAQGDPQTWTIHLGNDSQSDLRSEAGAVAAKIRAACSQGSLSDGATEEGYFVRFALHRDLGDGWIYLHEAQPDELAGKMLPLLGAQAANALYANIARRMLEAEQGNFYDQMLV
jgi:CheY-like chemotaxis protein